MALICTVSNQPKSVVSRQELASLSAAAVAWLCMEGQVLIGLSLIAIGALGLREADALEVDGAEGLLRAGQGEMDAKVSEGCRRRQRQPRSWPVAHTAAHAQRPKRGLLPCMVLDTRSLTSCLHASL